MSAQPVALGFAATMDGFRSGFDELRKGLEHADLDDKSRYRVELVFEEVVANIVMHGAGDGPTPTVKVAVDVGDEAIEMTFDDDGTPFDPTGRTDPVLPTTLADARVGGLGLMMVRRSATSVDYQRRPEGINRLVVRLPGIRQLGTG